MKIQTTLLAASSLLTLVALGGCSTIPFGYDPSTTAQQVKALAADKNAGVVCATIPTPLGPARVVVVNLDQRVIDTGGVTADAECKIVIQTTKVLPPPK